MSIARNATILAAVCALSDTQDQPEYKNRLLNYINSRIRELEVEAAEYGETPLNPDQINSMRQVYMEVVSWISDSKRVGVTRNAEAKLSLQILDSEVGKQLTLFIEPDKAWLELMWLDSNKEVFGPSVLFGDPIAVFRNEDLWQRISWRSMKLLDATGDNLQDSQLQASMV